MAFLVQKYGGTSLGSLDLIRSVAEHIRETRRAHDVVVVVSAMGQETDLLAKAAQTLTGQSIMTGPDYDFLLASAEQKSAALLALALNQIGCPARACSGQDAGIRTTATPQSARICSVDCTLLRHYLDQGIIPVVTGFQGVDRSCELRTIGRGGSDATAVALAASLGVDACHIYTDVDGVFNADPRIVEAAELKHQMTFSEMLEASDCGASVLQKNAVLIASRYNVPLRVLSHTGQHPGTAIAYDDPTMDQALISSINVKRRCTLVTIMQPLKGLGSGLWLWEALASMGLEIEVCSQLLGSDVYQLHCVVPLDSWSLFEAKQGVWTQEYPSIQWNLQSNLSVLSLVGSGLKSCSSLFAQIMRVCDDASIKLHHLIRSELKLSVYIDDEHAHELTSVLHAQLKEWFESTHEV
jgi:aspartate kinase